MAEVVKDLSLMMEMIDARLDVMVWPSAARMSAYPALVASTLSRSLLNDTIRILQYYTSHFSNKLRKSQEYNARCFELGRRHIGCENILTNLHLDECSLMVYGICYFKLQCSKRGR